MLTIDQRGKLCPQPILALGRAIRSQQAKTQLLLIADDPVAETDVPAWCRLVGATLLEKTPHPKGGINYLIEFPSESH